MVFLIGGRNTRRVKHSQRNSELEGMTLPLTDTLRVRSACFEPFTAFNDRLNPRIFSHTPNYIEQSRTKTSGDTGGVVQACPR
jgi:hypothetical protein